MADFNTLNLFVRVEGLSQVVIKTGEFHEAILIVSDDAIRLDVKFPDLDKISHRMATWNNEISFDSFGKLLVCENNTAYKEGKNESVSIDFSESRLLTYKGSTDSPYISFFIDKIKYSYDYPTDKNEAIFWLNDSGHKFVQDYYNVDWGVELPERMKIAPHNILGARCYPYFDFYRANGSHSREIIITKTPKIKWYDFMDVESVIKYNGWICQLASLFYGNDINYTGGRIDFEGKRTIIHQRFSALTLKSKKRFMCFIGLQYIYQFLEAVSFEEFKKFETYFEIIIERFIQSQNLNASSQYQVLYNILEICHAINCKRIKEDTEQNKKRRQKNERIIKEINIIKSELEIFFKGKLETIEDEDIKKHIEARCNAVYTKLNADPTSFVTEEYLKKQGFNMDAINSHIQKDMPNYTFFQLRSPIIHGSDINSLGTINKVLSHIGKILTLKLLGCPIQVSDILVYSDIYKGNNPIKRVCRN